MTAREAAALLGVHERTVRRAIAHGDLTAAKRGGVFRIAADDLDRYRIRRAGRGRTADDALEPATLGGAAGARLPTPLSSFVGREREVATVVGELRGGVRLLTLTGPGGVGKTRLALAAATAAAGAFPDGVRFVDLSAVTDPALVAATLARALGVRESGGEPVETRLAAVLAERRLLLVLDNLEQVVEAAPLLAGLLAACPRLAALVTSRVRLRVSGERERILLPLTLTPEGGPAPSCAAAPSEADQLFVERAREVRPDFALSAANAPVVAAICRRLDGLPLAIELAAARIKTVPPAALLARLDRRLPELTDGPRDAPARLRAMRDAIAWSHDLLDDGERVLFRRLSVFVGGFDAVAAENVSRGGTDAVLPHDSPPPRLLDSLTDKSLLRCDAVGDGVRYAMLETIREFALERLAASSEDGAVRERHAAWFLALAEDAGPRAKQPGAAPWVEALEREHPNLRAALGWLVEQGDGSRLLRMAGSLWPFWQEHSYAGEGLDWLERALDLGRDAPPADRIRALTGAGTLAWYRTRIEQAMAWHEEALALARTVGDRAAESFALSNISVQAVELGDFDRGTACLTAGLAAARAVGETEAMALALQNLACLAWISGDLPAARRWADEALAVAREHGWDWIVPAILVNTALVAADLGDLGRAAALAREGLALGHARGNHGDVAIALEALARAAAVGTPVRAVRLFAAADAVRDEIGFPQPPSERAYFAPFLDGLRRDLGPTAYAAGWSAGRTLTWQAAIDEGLAWRDPATAGRDPVQDPAPGSNLTPREREVLALLVAGESSRAIADRLFISPTTVATHVASILGKLGVPSRAKAATVARLHGLA